MAKSKKEICLVSIMVMFFVGGITNASSQAKKIEDLSVDLLPESQRSERVRQNDELFLWMDMRLNRHKKDFKKAVAEVADLVANEQPVKGMDGAWRIIKTIDSDQIIIFCRMEPVVTPQTVVKTSYYMNPISGKEVRVVKYRMHYTDGGEVGLFSKSDGEKLMFWEGKLERYTFRLNENRFYIATFDEKEKLKWSVIGKPRTPQKEKVPDYELYFPNKSDLDIAKNKILNRLKKAVFVASTKETKKNKDLKHKSVKTLEHDMDFDGDGKTARFLRKSTGEEVSFYSNGKIKSFSVPLPNGKKFKAEWDDQGKLVQ